MTLTPINLDIVVARPGARGDFVAGWLGSLTNYIDNQWHIDVLTGRSLGLMNCFKEVDIVDYGPTTLDRLLEFREYKKGSSEWYFAMSCHGNELQHKIGNQQHTRVIQIKDRGTNKDKILWEFFDKTFFCKERYECNIKQGRLYHWDSMQTRFLDKQRCSHIEQELEKISMSMDLDLGVDSLQELFCAGGSHALASKLNLDVDPVYHQLWDSHLLLADSRDCYQHFGRVWRKDDILAMLLNK